MLLSFPLFGAFGGLASSMLMGVAFCFTSTAASMFFKSCNCNSSIATRVGFAIIFALNSMFAWLMRTDFAIKQLQKWSYDYIKMDCESGKCYGVLAVHRICFALALFHAILSASLVGVQNTRTKRAAIQNGWWGPKVLIWLILLTISFFIPNGFFIFWGNYLSPIGATVFILLGLVLLIDFAHTWSETCQENWEDSNSAMWLYILVGSTAGMYAGVITITGLLYGFFAASGCTLNRFLITFNLILCIIVSVICIHPAIQDANPRSGLTQASLVALYSTYLIASAVGNRKTNETCNPIRREGAVSDYTVVLGALFTFLAIAYSTSRAATQSRALVGKKAKHAGAIQLANDEDEVGLINAQPGKKDSPRYQALLAAVEAGAIPASALHEEDDDDDDDGTGDERDDERTVTKYNYSWFHIIFVMGAMYVGVLLTDWNVVLKSTLEDQEVYIGRSDAAMWMRVVSSWACILLYSWSLLAPVVLPDRFYD